MLNLKKLSNESLLNQTKISVERERECTTQVLWHLREIEARKLFASLGFSSLFEYAVKELKYSEASAMRRINAMRLLRDLPEVEASLNEGTLTLSHLSSVQSFLRAEKKAPEPTIYSKEEKLELLLSLQGKSQREAEKILIKLSPEAMLKTQEKLRPLTESTSKLETVLEQRVLDKLERIRELSSHKLKSNSVSELIEFLADQCLEKFELKNSPKVAKPATSTPTPEVVLSTGRYIPTTIKRALFERSKSQCEFIEPKSKNRCSCKRYLQIDHIQPLALGGKTSLENLRVLCAEHNQWMAAKSFGLSKMQQCWR